ncbi:hypothetical protein BJY52DRAFT_1188584 [Lactarius psammicola]|nr:hypothetical protein BJY52DRAFT_1188584 [Lactarius psammicola]
MFGTDDEDWAIYRKINTAVMSESLGEEDDLNPATRRQAQAPTHDLAFGIEKTQAALIYQHSEFTPAFRGQYADGNVEAWYTSLFVFVLPATPIMTNHGVASQIARGST